MVIQQRSRVPKASASQTLICIQITKDLVKNEDSGTNLGQGWGVYISNRLLGGIIFWLVCRAHFFFQTLNFLFCY